MLLEILAKVSLPVPGNTLLLLYAIPWGNHLDSMQQLPMRTILVSVLCCSLTCLVGVEWTAVYEATEAYHEVIGPMAHTPKLFRLQAMQLLYTYSYIYIYIFYTVYMMTDITNPLYKLMYAGVAGFTATR